MVIAHVWSTCTLYEFEGSSPSLDLLNIEFLCHLVDEGKGEEDDSRSNFYYEDFFVDGPGPNIESLFKAVLTGAAPKAKRVTKVVKHSFADYKMHYKFVKDLSGYRCYLDLKNVPNKSDQSIKVFKVGLHSTDQLRLSFYYGSTFIEDLLTLPQKVTNNTQVIKYDLTNKILRISFRF